MSNQTINLEESGNPVSAFFRTASDNAKSWFTAPVQPKLETVCEFQRKNKIRFYRIRTLRSGETVLSIKTAEGKVEFEKARNFHLAFIKLQRNFYANLKIT